MNSKMPAISMVSISSLFTAMALPGVSVAQVSVSAKSRALEEVVVTAQRREQSLQDVPVAVTVFNSLSLQESGAETIVELQKSSPNTTLQTSRGTNSTLTAYIRGIGQADPLWGFEPGVGLYVDDVYLARPQAGVLDVIDVDRIEILRGPQGTLYGKNTIGGAVKYVTQKLTGERELSVKGVLGNYGQTDVKISAQMPLIDNTLSIGGAVASLQRDGFGEFILNGNDNYNKDVTAARISLEYTPSDRWFIRLSADDIQDDSNAKGGHRLTDSLITMEKPLNNVYDTRADMSTDNEVESSGAALTAQWDVSDALSLKSITAYREGETFTNIDFDNTPRPTIHVPAIYDDDQTTQEFQLIYNREGFHLVSGLYYYEGTASGAFDVLLQQFDADVDGDDVNENFDAVNAGTVDTTSYAVYTHATFDISPVLSLTLGGRYTYDEKEAEVYKERLWVENNSSRLGGEDVVTLSIDTDYKKKKDWERFSPRVSVDYRIYDNLMLYTSYSNGFKSGGFDMRGDARANPGTVNGYDPEEVDTYEVGLKSQLFENRLRLNAAVFYSDYTDVQVTVQESADGGANFVSAVLNAGKAEVSGLELEATAQLTESLSAVFNVGYLDADFTRVETQTETGVVDLADEWEFPNTPQWAGSFKLAYNHNLPAGGALVVASSVAYRDKTRIFPQVASQLDEDSYSLWDASVVWYSADEKWTLGLHGKNLTDREYRIAGYNFNATFDDSGNIINPGLGGEDTVVGYYGDPRTVSLAVGYKF